MKFLALLRDSLREAADAKVFYVTIGLTFLFLLLVASLSFRPVPMEEQVTENSRPVQLRIIGLTGRTDFSAEIVDFKQTKEPPPRRIALGRRLFASPGLPPTHGERRQGIRSAQAGRRRERRTR